eukprot:scaffold5779_cov108-Isochrysis_galbana.AAC.8
MASGSASPMACVEGRRTAAGRPFRPCQKPPPRPRRLFSRMVCCSSTAPSCGLPPPCPPPCGLSERPDMPPTSTPPGSCIMPPLFA